MIEILVPITGLRAADHPTRRANRGQDRRLVSRRRRHIHAVDIRDREFDVYRRPHCLSGDGVDAYPLPDEKSSSADAPAALLIGPSAARSAAAPGTTPNSSGAGPNSER